MNSGITRTMLWTGLLMVVVHVATSSRADDPAPPIPWKITEPPADWKLDPFYTKHVGLRGFPIVASEKVSDFALFEAAYVVNQMLAHRADVLEEMARNKVRLAVMAYSERTTDVPEHSDLKPGKYWDRRARGLGATKARPAVSCAEENLLGFRGDPYATESILVHEFAHAIHGMGLASLDPTFNDRLRKTHRSALDKGLWKGTYAATNPGEYWAEGVQSWFDTNRHDDAQHNHVDTREELEEYDPDLATLIADSLGRTDWRYTRPNQRAQPAHLTGFDREKAPTFAWEPELQRWYDQYLAQQAEQRRQAKAQGAPENETGRSGLLDPQKLLDTQSFWDNRDWDWYKANIPFFECPDADITTTYYYRWELITKHLTYGSTTSGYSFTEFIDRPFWSGRYGAISCPAGHQLYEVRWLKDPRYARDFGRYWFRTEGAQPRNYSCWLADAVWASHLVHPDRAFVTDLLPDLKRNYEGWERSHFDPNIGLFWQTGHDDGMEFNINSRQTRDILRGAPGYRPTLNAYLWADAQAIARVADLADEADTARAYRDRAAGLKKHLQERLWDPERRHFFPMSRQDEEREGHIVKAGTLTYQSGKYKGDPHGRELIGFVPWQFGLPDAGYESAWQTLMDPDGFFAPFGPTVVERHDPQFLVTKTCCWWSGQSWPYATSQTLKALANLLHDYQQEVITPSDYVKLLGVYARTHRKGGQPYLAEGADPDTGSFEGYDGYNHSEHYFHSSFNDLIITGLVGLRPRADEELEVWPLAPESWDYFAIDDLPYHGHRVAVAWDRQGSRYGLGNGLHVLVDGKVVASSVRMNKIIVPLPALATASKPVLVPVNFAANNDGLYYPRLRASFTAPKTSTARLIDGNFWYHVDPPNRWTCAGLPHPTDWLELDFGTTRAIDTIKLYVLDDGEGIVPPSRIDLDFWDGGAWKPIPDLRRQPAEPTGRRANVFPFATLKTTKLRATLTHREGSRAGLSEFEAWGPSQQSLDPAPMPEGNLAYNPGDRPFPRASASFTSRFDKVAMANDGRVSFQPSPANRWTSYESPQSTDWLEIDFGEPKEVGRVELAIYDDRGGVQAPLSYRVQFWDGEQWQDVAEPRRDPETPIGGQFNEVRFQHVRTTRVRVVFQHRDRSRSGLSEVSIWPE